ncbi:bifunctional 5,10-methylenetetrahydrofolate dehydrogenase/5,10-methenyltetrahydrofolate cyclohydrolase [Candidatus Gracilibacteria bacterium]|nr:bifunctional 5,10-methylenetetrahydrofolate dehydrogenase/5,10-methenyltetrahydrofolate cyclohydrolase [Candidatus Gracilibacteria bacterium]
MILSGTKLATILSHELSQNIQSLKNKPKLVAVLVGNNTASLRYIKQKKKASETVGIKFELLHLQDDISEQGLLSEIEKLNNDTSVSGYIVQLPLPNHINSQHILENISPLKDVDGFHPVNQGKVLIGDTSGLVPCTPKGVMKLLSHHNISLQGKKVTILGRSNIVGKPLAALCINAGATLTSCNSHTEDIFSYTRHADIVISAIGKAYFLKAEHVSPNAVLIDVGFSVVDGVIYGDIDFEGCLKQGNTLTPVPGGVGPLTVAMLLENTYLAHQRQLGEKTI